jgi:hypothetical protein
MNTLDWEQYGEACASHDQTLGTLALQHYYRPNDGKTTVTYPETPEARELRLVAAPKTHPAMFKSRKGLVNRPHRNDVYLWPVR